MVKSLPKDKKKKQKSLLGLKFYCKKCLANYNPVLWNKNLNSNDFNIQNIRNIITSEQNILKNVSNSIDKLLKGKSLV